MTSTDGATTPPPARRSRWLKIALAVSLAFNLLIVGFAVGAAWRFKARFGGGGGPDAAIDRFVSTLPEGRRGDVRQRLDARRPTIMQLRRELRQVRRTMGDVVRADPFDRPQFDRVRQNYGTLQSRLTTEIAETLGDVAEQLTVEERRELLRQWRRGRGPRRWRRDRDF